MYYLSGFCPVTNTELFGLEINENLAKAWLCAPDEAQLHVLAHACWAHVIAHRNAFTLDLRSGKASGI